ncbi:MAG: hypothetical protein DRN14_00085 [Thermoplasmata archaeon]|nr:MAG: hypothetical protein DRN14_00085 [Thermoplasmata archaeon]
MRIYDVRKNHPYSLIVSIHIRSPRREKTGFAMVSFYNDLRVQWLRKMRKRMIRLYRETGRHLQSIANPTRYMKKWQQWKDKNDQIIDN